MGDKCQAHDICMNGIREDLEEIKDMLRDGKIVHREHSWRIKQLEKISGGWDWKSQALRLVFGLIEKGIIVILGMAYYGYKVGWGN